MAARHPHPTHPPFRFARRAVPRTLPHHGYRAALVFVALMAGLTGLVWGASSEVIRAVGAAAEWLASHDTARGRMLATVLCAAAGALALIAEWGAGDGGAPPGAARGRACEDGGRRGGRHAA